MNAVRRFGIERLPLTRRALRAARVLPIRDHYYEPLIDPRHLTSRFSEPRSLSGVDWNTEGQQTWLRSLAAYVNELSSVQLSPNRMFGPGDAEYWYAVIRALRPQRIIEVGSGYSTQIAQAAIRRNGSQCAHTCIEPYEAPWIEKTGATIIRKRVEQVGAELFSTLQKNDILFIDSSHVIRPEGDVTTEILHILPALASGVVVHFHDIFSPRNYPYVWVAEEVRLWNEQYLLEAFLTHNEKWEIIGALNYLKHSFLSELVTVCPSLTEAAEPGSLYIRRK
jgi:uncharacterized UPF0146 family protein